MITVKELYDRLDAVIPKELSCEWDNDGLMLSPNTGAQVRRAVVALDVTDDTVSFAEESWRRAYCYTSSAYIQTAETACF